MNNNKLTLTVGISALNEERNISNLLRSLLSQKSNKYLLKKIIVVSDGSVDTTVKQAKSVNSNKVVIYDFKKREGMTSRLNFMFKKSTADIFVKIDADLLPVNKSLLDEIVKPFLFNDNVGLVGGKLVAKSTDKFVEKVINVARLTWDGIKSEYMGGNSFYSLPGGIYAISKSFIKHALFPKTIWSDVGYIYYSCKINNFKFVSNKKALVYLNLPTSFSDYIKQLSRYSSEVEPLVKLFGIKVKDQFYIPKIILYKYKAIYFIKYPIECLILFFINLYTKFRSSKSINANAKWQIAESSKIKI